MVSRTVSDVSSAVAVSSLLAPSLVLPGIALLLRGGTRLAAIFLVATGVAVIGAATALSAGHAATADRFALLGGTLLAPMTLLAYPRLRVSHPGDFLALVTVVAAGAYAIAIPTSATTMVLVLAITLGGHLWWRLETSQGQDRRLLTWLAVSSASSTLVAGTLSFAFDGGFGTVWSALAFIVPGPALLLATSRPDATDPRSVVVEVTATLTTMLAVVAVFVGIAAPLLDLRGIDLDNVVTSVLALLATGLAAAYGPVRRELRGVVGQLLLGRRPDPLTALAHVSKRLGQEPGDALHAVREGLGLPWAAVALDPPLSSGRRITDIVLVPLGEGLPDLEVGLRRDATRLSRDEERVLALAAPLLGQAIRLHRLGAQVSASREQTVRAVEEERLRLRRDLHDGLGPTLSGLAFTGDAVSNLLSTDPAAAAPLIAAVRHQARAALADVRRLVYGMRPPALDELGLSAAIAQAAGELHPLAQSSISVGELPPLSAAVEVAAYRIAVESLTNSARHAPDARVRVHLEVHGDDLLVEVRDDAATAPGSLAWRSGVGLSSMRERAEELGGRLEAGPTQEGGRVVAVLPLGGPTATPSPTRAGRR